MLERLLPRQIDNKFEGQRAALWLLGLLIAAKLVMSVNSILNTAKVAAGADGIKLDSFGPEAAREVVTLFALTALGQLALTLIALTVLIRWRAMVPFMFLVLAGEQLVRRLIVQSNGVARTGADVGWYVGYGFLALLTLGLALSLIPGRGARP